MNLYRCNDRNVMVHFEPSECTRDVFFKLVTQAARKKNSVPPKGFESTT